MKNIKFELGSSGESLSYKQLASTENEIGVKFPESFKIFMNAHNGGIPLEKYFSVNGNEKVLERFLSIIPDFKVNALGIYDIEVVWSQIEDRLNDYLCPFASLFGGDFLCFDTEKGNEARVVLWDHELSQEDSPVITIVAESFNGFLNMLREL